MLSMFQMGSGDSRTSPLVTHPFLSFCFRKSRGRAFFPHCLLSFTPFSGGEVLEQMFASYTHTGMTSESLFLLYKFFVLTLESNSYPFLTIFFSHCSALPWNSFLHSLSPQFWSIPRPLDAQRGRERQTRWGKHGGPDHSGEPSSREPASHLSRVAGQVADLSPVIATRKIQEGGAGKAKNKSKEVGVERDTSESFHGSVSFLSY